MGRGGGDIFITDITDTYREGRKEGREGQDTGGILGGYRCSVYWPQCDIVIIFSNTNML